MMRAWLMLFSSVGLVFGAARAAAQPAPDGAETAAAEAPPAAVMGEAVAATVNDALISTYDVRQRARLMMLSSGQAVPPGAMLQLQQRALRDLIEEKLKLQEAQRSEFSVNDAEVEAELQQVAAQGGISVAQLREALAQDGVDIASLRAQIQSQLVWQRLVAARYRDRVRIEDREIDEALTQMREDSLRDQYLVSEICLPVDNPQRARSIFEGGMQILDQMRQGVPFAILARQFSACPSAAAGGDIGWVRSGDLPPELAAAVRQLEPGAVTRPIPADNAFFILAVRDRQEAAITTEPSFDFVHVSTPISNMTQAEAREALMKVEGTGICNSDTFMVDLGPQVSVAEMKGLGYGDIDPRFHALFDDLETMHAAEPVVVDGAFHTVFLCHKDEGLGLPSREQLENSLFGQELSLFSRRYLRDVERDAAIDIRIPELALGARPGGQG